MNEIKDYIESFITYDNQFLSEIVKQDKNRNDIQPSIGFQSGKLLGLLIKATNAKRVLEFGTCLGYSTIWLAQGLKETGGKLISIEYNKELYETTKENIEAAGLSEVVELILGDANEVIDSLQGEFDIETSMFHARILGDGRDCQRQALAKHGKIDNLIELSIFITIIYILKLLYKLN